MNEERAFSFTWRGHAIKGIYNRWEHDFSEDADHCFVIETVDRSPLPDNWRKIVGRGYLQLSAYHRLFDGDVEAHCIARLEILSRDDRQYVREHEEWHLKQIQPDLFA